MARYCPEGEKRRARMDPVEDDEIVVRSLGCLFVGAAVVEKLLLLVCD